MSRVNSILSWYAENDKNDPNIYELIEVLSEYSRNADCSAKDVEELVKLEVERLFANGIIKVENDPLVKMVMEFKEKALKGEAVPLELEDYSKKVAGVSYWLKTEHSRRGDTFEYFNISEYRQMLSLEDRVREQGIAVGDNTRILMDYITVHGNDIIKKMRYSHINEVASKSPNHSEATNNKIASLVMISEPYVYPEKMEKMEEDVRDNWMLPIDIAMNAIVELGQGLDFDSVRKRLYDANLSSFYESALLSHIAEYAKRGPEFFMFMRDKDGIKISEDTMAHLQRIIEENKTLAAKHGENTDSVNYSM